MDVQDLIDAYEAGERDFSKADLIKELLVIRDVPADVCQQCNEACISARISERLDYFMGEYHRRRPERYLAVPQYSAAQAIFAPLVRREFFQRSIGLTLVILLLIGCNGGSVVPTVSPVPSKLVPPTAIPTPVQPTSTPELAAPSTPLTVIPTPAPSTATPRPLITVTQPPTVTPWPTPTMWGPTDTPDIGDGHARARHYRITYPVGDEAKVLEFLGYAEDVYRDLDYFFAGALPSLINITFEKGQGQGIRLRYQDDSMTFGLDSLEEDVYAHELTHVAFHEFVGAQVDLGYYGFFNEGLAVWVEVRYDQEWSPAYKYLLWSAYAYTQGWAEVARLKGWKQWNECKEELGTPVAYGLGYSFVYHFINLYGHDGLMELLDAMSSTSDIRSALDNAGYDSKAFIESWQIMLEMVANTHDLWNTPENARLPRDY